MTPNPQYPGQPAAPPSSGAPGVAVAALVFGILGALCGPCPFGLVGIILGIVALNRIGSTPGQGGRGMALAGIIVPAVALVFWIGVYAAVAIPNFIKFQARSKQAECKTNLKLLYASEKSFFAQKDGYSTSLEELGWDPERGNRYAYFLLDVGRVQDRSSATPSGGGVSGVNVDTFKYPKERPVSYADLPALAGGAKAGVHGQCPDCTFVAVCAGNLDKDDTLDVWSISTADRTSPAGETILAGTPYNDVSDLTE
jgi:hypothetical protein